MTTNIEEKCVASPLYGKDELKQLHFYCEYCGNEMGYDEVKKCMAEVELCECGHRIGDSDRSVSTCLNCNKKI